MLDDIIRQGGADYIDADMLFNPNYQANMYIIDQALKAVGASAPSGDFVSSAYDDALLKLIDSVPME